MKKVLVVLLAIVLSLSVGAFAGCNPTDEARTVRFVMPDGSPALAVTKLVEDGCKIDGEKIDIEVVTANLIGAEVAGEKADIAIMPTNAAANIIKNGGAYKIVATNIFGVLHLVGVGNPETFALHDLVGKVVVSIGQSNTPQFVFEAILTDAGIEFEYGNAVVDGKVAITFVADGSGVIGALAVGTATYGVIGEPAASVVGNKVEGAVKLFDLQEGYAQVLGVEETGYPQASLIVKTSLEQRPEFVEKVLVALEQNVAWLRVDENKTKINKILESVGSVTAFPPASIAGCNVRLERASAIKGTIKSYLSDLFDITLGDDAFYTPAK